MKHIDIQKRLNKNPQTKDQLSKIIEVFISRKEDKLSKEEVRKNYPKLKQNGILEIGYDDHYHIQFENREFQSCLLEFAKTLLKTNLPNDPNQGFAFLEEFQSEIRKPDTQNWWFPSGFLSSFINFVCLEYEDYYCKSFHELTELFEEKKGPSQTKKLYKVELCRAIHQFKLTEEQFLELADILFNQKDFNHFSQKIITNVSSQSDTKAKELWRLLNQQSKKESYKWFKLNVLCSLSKFDFNKAFAQSKQGLASKDTELVGLLCLGGLQYSTSTQIEDSFHLLKGRNFDDEKSQVEKLRMLMILLNHEIGTKKIKDAIFDELSDMIESEDNLNILDKHKFHLSIVKGFEDRKMKLLSVFLNKKVSIDFWNYFKEFESPRYLFDFIRKMNEQFLLKASLKPFMKTLNEFERNHADKFERELLELLTDPKSINRKAATDFIVESNYRPKVDLLKLDQNRQLIVVDTLLSFPFLPKKVLHFTLPLFYSQYKEVREELIKYWDALIYGYQDFIIEFLESNLDLNKKEEKKVFKMLSETWNKYKAEIESKFELQELNPWNNQRYFIETYSRIEREHLATEMENIFQNDQLIATGLATRNNILRGSSYRIEGGNGLFGLSEVKTKIPLDKRRYQNPNKYDWDLKNHYLNKNYTIN